MQYMNKLVTRERIITGTAHVHDQFFFFTFRWHCVQRACGVPLLQIHRLIFDIQIPAARGAQLL